MKRKLLFLTLLSAAFGASLFAQKSPSNPVGANITAADAGTCSTVNTFLWQQLPNNAGTTTVNLAGTFVATVTIRESNNGGGTWSTATTLSAAGTTTFSTNGFTDICADVTAFTSGTVQVSLSTGLLQVQSVVSGGSSSSASPSLPATCTPGSTANVFLVINSVNYGEFYCGGVNAVANTWVALNPNQTVSPLAYGAKADVKFIYDCAWTTGTSIAICANGDALFQCPNASFPCSSGAAGCPGATCDAGKIVFGVSSTSAVNTTAITASVTLPQGTISTVNSTTSITVSTTTTATCPTGGLVNCNLAWGSADDTTAINNAAAAAWNGGNNCKALQLPSSNMFYSAAILNGPIGNNCGVTSGGSGNGSDLNAVGPELFGAGQNVSVLVPLPNFTFTGCTGGSGATCVGGVPNLQAHDFGINGLQNPIGGTHAVTLFELFGSNGGALCDGGATAWNISFAGWGLTALTSTGFKFGVNSCNDAYIANVNAVMFGAQTCNVTPNNTITAYSLFCFGSNGGGSIGVLQISSGGFAPAQFNSFGSQYACPLANNGSVVRAASGTIFNSSGDFIQSFASCAVQQSTVNINGGTGIFNGDNIIIASGAPAGSVVFFDQSTNGVWHFRNSVLTGTGTNNALFNLPVSDKVFDEGGNTYNNGTVANTLSATQFSSIPKESGSVTCSASAATITFNGTYRNNPVVIIQDQTTAGVVTQTSLSTTTKVVGCPGASDVLLYTVTPNPF